MAVARYTLAVDRRGKNQENSTDFIQCVEHSARRESSLRDTCIKEQRLCLPAEYRQEATRIKEGQRVYTTDIVAEDQEFAESKAFSDSYAASHPQQSAPSAPSMPNPVSASADVFMNIPDGIDEELPFN